MKIKTYIIHWNTLSNRKKRLEEMLKKIKTLDVNWIIQKGNYSNNFLKDYYKENPREWRRKAKICNLAAFPRKIGRKYISLWINDYKALKSISEEKEPYGLILEDDTIFLPSFDQKINELIKILNTKNWDICFLDYLEKHMEGTNKKNKSLIKKSPLKCYGGNGILIKREAAKRILLLGRKHTLPNDEELKYRMHFLKLNLYWANPPLVVQGSKTGIYESTLIEERDNPIKILKLFRVRYFLYRLFPKKIQEAFRRVEVKAFKALTST